MRRARFLLWLDVSLLLFALLEEPVTTGLFGHEWISIGFAGLLALHLLVNWRWIAAALGRYRIAARRARVNTWLNGALYVTMVFTIFSSAAPCFASDSEVLGLTCCRTERHR